MEDGPCDSLFLLSKRPHMTELNFFLQEKERARGDPREPIHVPFVVEVFFSLFCKPPHHS